MADTYRSPPPPRVKVQALPSSSEHGVPTKQLTRQVGGLPTQVLIQEYFDRTVVLITQIGKIGVLTQASLPADTPFASTTSSKRHANYDFEDTEDEAVDEQEANPLSLVPNLVQTALLGIPPEDQSDLYSLYVSSIYSILRVSDTASRVAGGSEEQEADRRPVIIGLGLRLPSAAGTETADVAEAGRESFLDIVQAVRDCYSVPSS